jgi:hypothetical protein
MNMKLLIFSYLYDYRPIYMPVRLVIHEPMDVIGPFTEAVDY